MQTKHRYFLLKGDVTVDVVLVDVVLVDVVVVVAVDVVAADVVATGSPYTMPRPLVPT